MSVRNPNWYDRNDSSPWPVDDSATLIDDRGLRLPHDILSDLYLRFPSDLGDRAFIGGLTLSPGLATLVILGNAAGFPPIAAVSVPKPVEIGVHYAVQAMAAGVGGWLVFGSGTNRTELSLRFSTPTQSLLLAQAARAYHPLPVPSIGVSDTTQQFSGIVRLSAGNDLTIEKQQVTIDGETRDAAVIRLKDKLEQEASRNLLEIYAGECGRRPESGNCGDPEPIETINLVRPDCCGNIYLEFRGCADLFQVESTCGVLIDCGFELAESCITPDRLPDDDGNLPNEYDDRCADYEIEEPAEEQPTHIDYAYATRSFAGSSLPYTEDFEDRVADHLTVVSGEFIIADDTSSVVFEAQDDDENIAIWNLGIPQAVGWDTLFKRATTIVAIKVGAEGTKDNGGLIFNYQDNNNFWLAEIDWQGEKSFNVYHNANGLWRKYASTRVAELNQHSRYRITVDIVPLNEAESSAGYATARLEGLDDGIIRTLYNIVLPGYLPGTGYFGLYSNRSLTWFEELTVADQNP